MKIQWARWPDRPLDECDFFAIELKGFKGEVQPTLFEPHNVYHMIIPKSRLAQFFGSDETKQKSHPFEQSACPHERVVQKLQGSEMVAYCVDCGQYRG
jgi:hypothetical protein